MLPGLALSGLLATVACSVPTIPVPAHEPVLTRGPSELVAGLYVQGGAYIVGCPQQPRGPYAGTLSAISTQTGRVVARETLHQAGKLFVLKLPPGSYTLRATNSSGLRAAPSRVRIPAHRSVRQDVFVDVP
jgi:hypothetical protein